MMKRMMTFLTAVVALPALAACGGNAGNQASTADLNNLVTADQNQLPTVNEVGNVAAEPEPSAPVTRNSVEPAQRTSPAPRPERPAPRPKAEPVDPHAGHDMGNMANMSR